MDRQTAVVVEVPTEVTEDDGGEWSPSSVRQLRHLGCAGRNQIVECDAASMQKMHSDADGKCEVCQKPIVF